MKTFTHPKAGDIRIKKIRCIFPYRFEYTSYWIGTLYVMQVYRDSYVTYSHWDIVQIVTEAEYKQFKSLKTRFTTMSEYTRAEKCI